MMALSNFWSGKRAWNVALADSGIRLWQRRDEVFEIDSGEADKLCALLRKPPALPVNTVAASCRQERIYVVRAADRVEVRRGARAGRMSLDEARGLAEKLTALCREARAIPSPPVAAKALAKRTAPPPAPAKG